MNAYMTVYWFATGHQLGTIGLNFRAEGRNTSDVIKVHNRLCDWFNELDI